MYTASWRLLQVDFEQPDASERGGDGFTFRLVIGAHAHVLTLVTATAATAVDTPGLLSTSRVQTAGAAL